MSRVEVFQGVNPATDETLYRREPAGGAEIEAALVAAEAARAPLRALGPQGRAEVLNRAARLLRERRDLLAHQISLEMGKPLAEALGEIEKSAWNCEHVAASGPEWLAERAIDLGGRDARIARRPIGVLFAVMPWNFPVWQIFRFAPAALMAGNPVLLKHAPNVQGSGDAVEALWRDAGLPEGAFRNLRLAIADVPGLIADRRIAAVTLTGGPGAGASVAALAGGSLKKSVLELGGSDPFIVLADADVAAAAAAAARGRFSNSGQVCLAPKRFILDAAIAETFLGAFRAHAEALVVGDPLSDSVTMGPLARADLREELHGQVSRSLAQGARLRLGGVIPSGPGAFYPPTILTQVTPDMPVGALETFGPVAAVMTAANEGEAVALANASRFGLSSNLWTGDPERALRLAADLEAGGVFINGVSASDPRTPVGGVKASGYGRELGPWGMDEFVNLQTIVIG